MTQTRRCSVPEKSCANRMAVAKRGQLPAGQRATQLNLGERIGEKRNE